MLREYDVVNAVCIKLAALNYEICQSLQTTQHGDDIIASKQMTLMRRLFVEAKGETSSRIKSQRYGKPFNTAQIRTHIAEAFYKAASVLSREQNGVEMRTGIALPDTDKHRVTLNLIQPALNQLGIAIFWVCKNGDIEIISNWEV